MKETRLQRFLENRRGRVKTLEEPLPTASIEVAEVMAVTVFKAQRGSSTTPLEVADSFGNWRPKTDSEVAEDIVGHLENLAAVNRRMDACRGIKDMRVIVFEGGRRTPYDWLIDLRTTDVTQLGDGTAVHLGGGNWGFTQAKGVHENTADLLIRQTR